MTVSRALFHYKDNLSKYGGFHYKDNTVVRLSYHYNGNPYLYNWNPYTGNSGKTTSLYWISSLETSEESTSINTSWNEADLSTRQPRN